MATSSPARKPKPSPSATRRYRSGNKQIGYTTVTLDERTIAALGAAEEILGFPICIGQGSYTGGAVAASGTTHDKGSTVDARVRHLTTSERVSTVKALKKAGFAAWYRDARTGFPPHIHAVLIDAPEASTSAKWQVREYLAGRNGLSNASADNMFRPDPQVRFHYPSGMIRPR